MLHSMYIDRRYFRYFDWVGFSLLFVLSLIGVMFVYSATYRPEQPYSLFFKKQLVGICGGLIIYLVFCAVDYRTLCRFGYFIYFGVMVLLLFTMIKGHIGMGAKRWVDLGFFKVQPSELAKLLFPSFIAYYFETERESGVYKFKEFIPALIILGISALLILKQPDLGTAIILLASGVLLLWLAGMPRWFFIVAAIVGLVTAPIAWGALKEYQRKRVMVFLGYGDMRAERYQIEQSKIAIGSGGLLGKGFLRGTQNKYLFLPESRTDFIFSVVAEEMGFVGALILLAIYMLIFVRIFWRIGTIHSLFAQLLAAGLVIPLALSTIINIGMVSGLLPIVGIPLPFMSYGISHLWTSYASLGWINGIIMTQRYSGGTSHGN
jgi:rod shape determining protein RodA